MADGSAASTLGGSDASTTLAPNTLYTQPTLLDPTAVAKSEGAALTANQKSRAAALAVDDQRIKELGLPPKYEPTPFVAPEPTSPLKQWGSLAMVAAALLPLLSRQSLTAALNAAGDVMKAFKTGDQNAANFAYQQWKDANDIALKQANYALDTYKTILGEYYNHEDAILKMSAADEQTITALAQGNFTAIGDTINQAKAIQQGANFDIPAFNEFVVNMEGVVQNLAAASKAVPGHVDDLLGANQDLQALTNDPGWYNKTPQQQYQDVMALTAKYPHFASVIQQTYGSVPNPGASAALNPPENWKGQWTGSNAQLVASGVIDGSIPPTMVTGSSGFSGLSGERAQVVAILKEQGFNISKAVLEWTAQQQLLRTVNQTPIIRQRTSILSLQQTLEKLKQLGADWQKAGATGNLPVINAYTISLANQGIVGEAANKAIALFRQQVIDVQFDLASVFRNGNTPTDQTITEAQQQIDVTQPLQTFLAAADLISTNAQYRLNALNEIVSTGPLGTADNRYDSAKQLPNGNLVDLPRPIDPESIGDPNAKPTQQATQPAPQEAGGLNVLDTQTQVDALPKGAHFRWFDPDTGQTTELVKQ